MPVPPVGPQVAGNRRRERNLGDDRGAGAGDCGRTDPSPGAPGAGRRSTAPWRAPRNPHRCVQRPHRPRRAGL